MDENGRHDNRAGSGSHAAAVQYLATASLGVDKPRFCGECGGELIEPTFITRRGRTLCYPCSKLHREADDRKLK